MANINTPKGQQNTNPNSNSQSNPNIQNMNNNGNMKLSQLQQQQQQQSQHPLANYTLPGVINYLTSEFTDLERFKIMTNLEKSEMKYKIIQLQGELNSMKFISEKQKSRIDTLERENKELHGKLDTTGLGDAYTGKDSERAPEPSIDIPEIDLLTIKKSRVQLTKSMNEVLHLLKTPTANGANALKLPDPNEEQNEFDELLNPDKGDNFVFNDNSYDQNKNNDRSRKYSKDSIFSQYLNDIPFNSKPNKSKKVLDSALQSSDAASEFRELNTLNAQYLNHIQESPEEKEAFPAPHYKIDESDSETMILDESDVEDPSQSLSNELSENLNKIPLVPTKMASSSLDPNTANPVTSEIEPKNVISTGDPEYSHCKLFPNNLKDVLIYLNFNDNSENRSSSLTIWSISLNKVLVSCKFSSSIIERPADVVGVYCISNDEASGTTHLLIITKLGLIDHIIIPKNSQIAKTCIINLPSIMLNSTKLIEFSHKSDATSKSFGLAIAGTQKPGTNPFLKIYNLTLDKTHSVYDKEIGSYVRSFFKLPNLQESDDLEVVHWFHNIEADASTETSSPKSNKGKGHKRMVSCTDVTLSPYELVLKLGNQLVRFNIVLKKYDELIDHRLLVTTTEVCFNAHLVILAEVLNESHIKLKLFDLVAKSTISETSFDSSFSSKPCFAIVNHNKKYSIARLENTHLQLYDLGFSLLTQINISALPNVLWSYDSSIILATMLDSRTENLAIYDINTVTAYQI